VTLLPRSHAIVQVEGTPRRLSAFVDLKVGFDSRRDSVRDARTRTSLVFYFEAHTMLSPVKPNFVFIIAPLLGGVNA
jgi:hypothetical protein